MTNGIGGLTPGTPVRRSGGPAPALAQWNLDELRPDPVPADARDRCLIALADRLRVRASNARRGRSRSPWWIEYPKSFFPVLLIVFMLRSFVVEPFKIPSLVDASDARGRRLHPGQQVHLRHPPADHREEDRSTRRPAARRRGGVPLPGQSVAGLHQARGRPAGRHGRLPGQAAHRQRQSPWPQTPDGSYSYLEGLRFETLDRMRDREHGGGAEHAIHRWQIRARRRSTAATSARFPGRENCDYNERGFTCKVPAGHYFMMGDNRDNSDDSRYWGFVPDDHIRGKAFFIWFNWDDLSSLAFKRIGIESADGRADETSAFGTQRRVVDAWASRGLPSPDRSGRVWRDRHEVGFRTFPSYIEYFTVKKAMARRRCRTRQDRSRVPNSAGTSICKASGDYIEFGARQRHRRHQGRQRRGDHVPTWTQASLQWSAT